MTSDEKSSKHRRRNPTAGSAQAEAEIRGWLRGRLPENWFTGEPDVTVDRDEVVVVGTLPSPGPAGGSTAPAADGPTATDDDAARVADAAAAETASAEAGRISKFREETRGERIAVARELQHRAGRTVSWGAECGGTSRLFTHVAAPIMTRLRQPERQVLDTLVEAGVARSRSDALAWSVKLVGQHSHEWLGELRTALSKVDEIRAQGPAAS